MSTKPTVLIVHGMGEHTEESFSKEVKDALKYALTLYDAWKGKDLDDLIDIAPFEYNSIFNTHRKMMADNAKPLSDRLAALKLKGVISLAGAITELDSKLNSDNFYATHWLDVIFYRYTTLAEPIRLKLAKLLTSEIASKGAEDVHILGHSLGTSIVHDTLASLYSKNYKIGNVKNLSPKSEKLSSVHMVANVSNVLSSFVQVDQSIVNPCKDGCTRTYYQYRHMLDPFVIPSPFDPVENNVWCDDFELNSMKYQEIRPKIITDMNTHSIGHYLRNPMCHVPFLKTLNIGFWPSDEEIVKAFNKHKAKSLKGRAELVRSRWNSLKLNDYESGLAFIKSGQALRDMLVDFGQEFK